MVPDSKKARRVLFYAALASTAFVIYGSLLPLDFHPLSLHDIRLAIIGATTSLVSASLTDRLVNVLLSIPIAFFAFGAFSRPGNAVRSLFTAFLVFTLCVVLASAIEFLQLFLPARTSSLADIIAQSIGTVSGIVLWTIAGGPVLKVLTLQSLVKATAPQLTPRAKGLVSMAAIPYCALLLVLNGWFRSSWLSFSEAADKARSLHLAPFYYAYFANFFLSVYSVCTNFILYLPVGVGYWLYSRGSGSRFRAALLGCGIAFVTEAGKLFIATKNPDSTNVLLGAISSVAAFTLWPRIVWRLIGASLLGVPAGENKAYGYESHQAGNGSLLRLVVFRTFGAVCFGLVLLGLYFYPVGSNWLALAVGAYTVMLFRFSSIWLIVIPALLPSFDLAPWTGSFFFDEFDFFVLVTIGAGLWLSATGMRRVAVPWVFRTLFFAIGFSYLISLLIGLWPPQAIDANAFANYYSHYNALRAAKGVLLLIGLMPLLFYNLGSGVDVAQRLSTGMAIGLATAIGASLWERAMFPGLLNFSDHYRISALFSSMHTGGSAIEAYLVAALPFAIVCGDYRKSISAYTVAVISFVLGTYALFVTFSRGGYVAYVAVTALLITGGLFVSSARTEARRRAFIFVLMLSIIIGAMMSVFVLEGSFPRSRLAQGDVDLVTRLDHWRHVIVMMDSDWQTTTFGMGLGRYPETDLKKNWSVRMPASYAYISEGGKQFLRLGSGTPAYLEQIVDVKPGNRYKIALDLRGAPLRGSLNVMLCERTFFRSYNCRDSGVWSTGTQAGWIHREVTVDSGPLGSGPWPFRRTVKFILENTSRDTAVDIDNVRLTDRTGIELLANGDFSKGNDRWFYSSFDHRRWHIENIWVQVFFEQGVVGIFLFSFLIVVFLIVLSKAVRSGKFIYTALLASVVGFLCVGLFGSPLDVPRLSFLFYLLITIGVLCASASVTVSESAAAEERHSVDHPMDLVSTSVDDSRAAYRHGVREDLQPRASRYAPIWDVSALTRLVFQVVSGMLAIVGTSWLIMHSSLVPYNVRNLLHPVHPVLSLVVLAMFLYWSLGFPVVIVSWITHSRTAAWFYPALVLLHSTIAWFVLTYSVSFDRILKIVGSPVLNWHWYWEPAGRFLALFSAISLSITAGTLISICLTQHRERARLAFACWIVTTLALSPFLYWVVVTEAATDNLVELTAGGGTRIGAFFVATFVALVALGGSLLAAQFKARNNRRRMLALVCVLISMPLTYLAFTYGTAKSVAKYGNVFSAMQFLLSQDREHYATGFELTLRYVAFHCGLMGAFAFVQYPFFAWLYKRR